MMPTTRKPRSLRRGHTLLELILATTLLLGALVPALRLMRTGMTISREIEQRGVMATLCVSKLEQRLAATAASWTTGTVSGNFSAEGYATTRFQVVADHALAGGGIPDRLMAVTATVWEDTTANGSWDVGEPYVALASKVAKVQNYVDQAAL